MTDRSKTLKKLIAGEGLILVLVMFVSVALGVMSYLIPLQPKRIHYDLTYENRTIPVTFVSHRSWDEGFTGEFLHAVYELNEYYAREMLRSMDPLSPEWRGVRIEAMIGMQEDAKKSGGNESTSSPHFDDDIIWAIRTLKEG